MKILICEGNIRLADSLLQAGFDSCYFCFNRQAFNKYNPDLIKVPVISTNVSRTDSSLKRFIELFRVIKNNNITHVITSRKTEVWMLYIIKKTYFFKLRLFSTNHNSYAWINPKQVKYYTYFLRLFTDGYLSLASFVTKQMIQYGYKASNILNYSNPIDPNIKPKNNFEMNKDAPKLVYLATIYPGKGHKTLIESVLKLKEIHPNIQLNIIGDAKDEIFYKELIEYSETNNLVSNIHFLGRIDNEIAVKMVTDADIYVNPSTMEMCPINILEACAGKMPIVAVNTSGVVDIIKDEINGLLIPPNNVDKCVAAVERLITNDNLREKLAKKAYEIVHKNYTYEYQGDLVGRFISTI